MELTPVVKAFLAGSFSGTCSTIIFQPLDLVKTKIQHNASPISRGMMSVATDVVATHKVWGLWKGLVPSVTRTVPGVGIYFSSMHMMKTHLFNKKPGPVESILVGAVGRSIAGVALIPVTVVKTRFESGVFKYNGVIDALWKISRQEGFKGLSSGLLPTLIRDAPFSGIYLMFYEQFKSNTPSALLSACPNSAHFMCGVGAGVMASTVTHPADVIKTKMQVCSGVRMSVMQTVLMVHASSGSMGFWRGLTPRLLRRTMMAALAWTVYENVMRNAGLK